MQIFESRGMLKMQGCRRCGNKKFTADPLSPFPYCDECAQCPECDGAKIIEKESDVIEHVVCERCGGRGYILKNVTSWGPSRGGGHEYDEEGDDFFEEIEASDEDIEALSLDELADEEFVEFADDDDEVDFYDDE